VSSAEELGKKEKAERDAHTAGMGSEWEDDLNVPMARPN
jgi:hypothetical protein